MSMPAATRLQELLDFLMNCPENDEIEAMDCNDHCEKMACLAEKVAAGATLEEIRPALEKHMQYWRDCREEFIALVNVLKMESVLDNADS
jgi:phosphomevalonate kinase